MTKWRDQDAVVLDRWAEHDDWPDLFDEIAWFDVESLEREFEQGHYDPETWADAC